MLRCIYLCRSEIPTLLHAALLFVAYSLFVGSTAAFSDDLMADLKCIGIGIICVLLLAVGVVPALPHWILRALFIWLISSTYVILFAISLATQSAPSVRTVVFALRTTRWEELLLLANQSLSFWLLALLFGSLIVLLALSVAISVSSNAKRKPAIQGILAFAGFLGIAFFLPSNREPVSRAIYAMFKHPLASITLTNYSRLDLGAQEPFEELIDYTPRMPHIFIVLMESLNPIVIDRFGPDGSEITPTLNRLKREAIWFESFYGNGTYSFTGQIALLGSIFPSCIEPSFAHYEKANFDTLPARLLREGYETWYFTALPHLVYNPPSLFGKRLGFNYVQPMDSSVVAPNKEADYGPWGLCDEEFYRTCLRRLSTTKGKPIFAVLANGSNHFPFQIPMHERQFYLSPRNQWESYVNSVAYADRSLKTFLLELEASSFSTNSIVIVVGDHGYPIQESSETSNISGASRENFATVCAIYWPDVLKARSVHGAWSQVDIAPLLLNLLGMDVPRSFVGNGNMNSVSGRVALCSQPFDGGFLCALDDKMMCRYRIESHRFDWLELNGRGLVDVNDLERRNRLKMLVQSLAAYTMDFDMNPKRQR